MEINREPGQSFRDNHVTNQIGKDTMNTDPFFTSILLQSQIK